MPRILCISPHFAPRADSEAFCGGKFILELLKQGVELTVLCRDPRIPDKKPCDDSKLWEPLEAVTESIATPPYKQRLYSAGISLRYGILGYTRWIKSVIDRAVCLSRKKPFDVLYSRALPMEANVAAYWTARRLNIPWIANINDPWDWHLFPEDMKLDYPMHQRIISTQWMKKTLNAATLVTYPSARLRDYHIRISGVAHRSEIVPHVGFRTKNEPQGKGGFRLLHAGKLGGLEKRSSDGLLIGASRFIRNRPEARETFRMILVGAPDAKTDSRIEELGLRSFVESTGRVSYEKSLDYIASATVCVLVEGNLAEGIFLPSKLTDYLTAEKPVLALSPKSGVIADMTPDPGLVRADPDDAEAVEAALHKFYHAYTSGSLDSCKPSPMLMDRFKPDRVAQQFIELVYRTRCSFFKQPRELMATEKTAGV